MAAARVVRVVRTVPIARICNGVCKGRRNKQFPIQHHPYGVNYFPNPQRFGNVAVHSCPKRPKDAFAAFRSRDHGKPNIRMGRTNILEASEVIHAGHGKIQPDKDNALISFEMSNGLFVGCGLIHRTEQTFADQQFG